MTHKDPMAKKEVRYRVNLNHYQAGAIEALAMLHRQQAATYLAEVIKAHLKAKEQEPPQNNISHCA